MKQYDWTFRREVPRSRVWAGTPVERVGLARREPSGGVGSVRPGCDRLFYRRSDRQWSGEGTGAPVAEPSASEQSCFT